MTSRVLEVLRFLVLAPFYALGAWVVYLLMLVLAPFYVFGMIAAIALNWIEESRYARQRRRERRALESRYTRQARRDRRARIKEGLWREPMWRSRVRQRRRERRLR